MALRSRRRRGQWAQLDRPCREHDAYKWLCGGVSLNYHTLNDFRVSHEKPLDELFTEVLTALTERGVVTVDRISQDGKRVRASAGSSSFHREKTLRRRLKEVRAYVEELRRQPDEAPGESGVCPECGEASKAPLAGNSTGETKSRHK